MSNGRYYARLTATDPAAGRTKGQLVQRQQTIEDELDLTKNQAPSQAESTSDDATEEATQKQSATKAIRPARRSTIRV